MVSRSDTGGGLGDCQAAMTAGVSCTRVASVIKLSQDEKAGVKLRETAPYLSFTAIHIRYDRGSVAPASRDTGDGGNICKEVYPKLRCGLVSLSFTATLLS